MYFVGGGVELMNICVMKVEKLSIFQMKKPITVGQGLWSRAMG